MIITTHEIIYGIDVYTFRSSRGIPYQLTFQENESGKYVDVCLINLLGSIDAPYCNHLRSAVSKIVYDYLLRHKCKLFFNIEYSDKRKLLLLIKFLRWIALDKRVLADFQITQIEGIEYAEIFLTLNKEFVKKIKVNI